MMKRYRLDPAKPRQLTPAEARRLVAAPIDYSDIPPLGDEFFAQAKAAWGSLLAQTLATCCNA